MENKYVYIPYFEYELPLLLAYVSPFALHFGSGDQKVLAHSVIADVWLGEKPATNLSTKTTR